MTIFIDPYHTTTGMVTDMSRTVTSLKECTIREPLTGTNLGVRTVNDIIPVFITGCRVSEGALSSFTHPIFIKNFNGKSYLFTDMTLFVRSGGTLETLDSHIRHREEFEFTKARAIASLVWAAGETNRFKTSMTFAGDVFAAWIGQTLTRAFALDFVASNKIKMLAMAYWESLFMNRPLVLSQDDDVTMTVAQKVHRSTKLPVSAAVQFFRSIDTPISNINDFCSVAVKVLDNVNLNPLPGRPETGFNLRVLLNLIADSWFSTKSKEILAVALEHPPTLAAIIYYCMNYNNFKRQQLGQTIQSVGRGEVTAQFKMAFAQMLEEYTRPEVRLVSVMEYMDPSVFHDPSKDDESAVARLMEELTSSSEMDELNKIANTNEGFGTEVFDEIYASVKKPGVEEANSATTGGVILNQNDLVDGRPTY